MFQVQETAKIFVHYFFNLLFTAMQNTLPIKVWATISWIGVVDATMRYLYRSQSAEIQCPKFFVSGHTVLQMSYVPTLHAHSLLIRKWNIATKILQDIDFCRALCYLRSLYWLLHSIIYLIMSQERHYFDLKFWNMSIITTISVHVLHNNRVYLL